MSIELYTFKDADGNEHSFTTLDAVAALAYAENNNLCYYANTYEFVDRELVRDFSVKP